MPGLVDPSRGIYGFVFYLVTFAILGVYLVWAIFPDKWLHYIGLSYLPQKYWAVVIPLYIGVSSIMLLLLYTCYSIGLTPPFDDMRTITDDYALYENPTRNPQTIMDIPLTTVNRQTYTKK